jgi:hypothetical protein
MPGLVRELSTLCERIEVAEEESCEVDEATPELG